MLRGTAALQWIHLLQGYAVHYRALLDTIVSLIHIPRSLTRPSELEIINHWAGGCKCHGQYLGLFIIFYFALTPSSLHLLAISFFHLPFTPIPEVPTTLLLVVAQ